MNRLNFLTPASLVSIAMLGASAIGFRAAIETSGANLRKRPINPPGGLGLPSLPAETETWERLGSDPPPLSAEILESLGTRNYISRNFVKNGTLHTSKPVVVDLHCAYYTGRVDTVPHIPEQCFVGGGMTLTSRATLVPIPLDLTRFPPDPTIKPELFDEAAFGVVRRGRSGPESDSPGARARMPFGLDDLKLRVTEYKDVDGSSVFAGYFFIANGWAVADTLQVRQRAFDLTADYAYYLKVQFTSRLVDSPEELGEVAADLLNEIFPDIMRRAPDWVDVMAGVYPPAGDVAEETTRGIRGTTEFETWKDNFTPPDLPGRRR